VDHDDAMQSWHLHTQVAHMDSYIELICKPSAEDGVTWVVEVYCIECYILYSYILLASEGHWQTDFPERINFLSSKTN
jgi:hypothetical protein